MLCATGPLRVAVSHSEVAVLREPGPDSCVTLPALPLSATEPPPVMTLPAEQETVDLRNPPAATATSRRTRSYPAGALAQTANTPRLCAVVSLLASAARHTSRTPPRTESGAVWRMR